MGSFLNCLIYRLHTGESMMTRSHCPKCKAKISWYDNIPVFSYILLLGKCRHCRERISLQYPAVELAVGVLFMLAFQPMAGPPWTGNPQIYLSLFKSLFVISIMTIIFIYDLKWYLIEDRVTLPAMAVVLIINSVLGIMNGDLQKSLFEMLISGIIGGGFFLIQFIVSDGKWIGGGDIRLGFLMGLILPWPHILTALMLAYVAGSFVAIFLILIGKKKLGSKLPFGVFLSTATIIAMFYGDFLVNWYFNLF